MMAQMAAQVEASAQRLPSEEATAERKLGSGGEMVGEWATPADAAEMSLELRQGDILGEHGELALGSSRFKSVDHEKQADRQIGKCGRIGSRSCDQAGRFGGVDPLLLPPGRGAARPREWATRGA